MPPFNTVSIIEAIRSVSGDTPQIPLHEPEFGDKEWELVKDCLDSNWVSTAGEYVNQFERGLERKLEVKNAVAVVNGTSALHLCLLLAGVKPGDEVIMPALGFIATANAISYCGADPHFVDCNEVNFGLDATELSNHLSEISEIRNGDCFNRETNKKISAIIVVHLFGHPASLDELLEIADRYGIPIIEDAAEALGSLYKNRAAGTFGMAAALSFNGNKIITSGGGGALLTNDKDLADRARHLSTTARLPQRWHYEHDEIGFNYRMPNLNAALGCAQLEQLGKFVEEKRALAHAYQSAFAVIEGITIVSEPVDTKSNYWLNVMLLDRGLEHRRDQILKATNDNGIMTRPAWNPLHKNEPFKNCPRGRLDQTESIYERLINLPSSPKLGRKY